ncbi:eukaryotic translation initiation factor 3 subunit 3 [Neohortaea acidophila]|uniref:Eukaryotic translation initiation factor 3 subunit H n=1 Tax=Neohortaea acidophila TaxID=245834 RepID=A0A6A6PW32_9PEZI|nr:eukaryotic translation initiation factor 3 subunit 3 [Neohortaea acidophila]KAF2484350.1 eukaryotic translation initiation factor 3 subunit 3 [Neohortaea acidophila]
MADSAANASPIREVQIEALVVMRIIKHSTSAFPTPATGCLVGMDIPSSAGTQLQVTNCFPFPASVPEQSQQDQYYQADAAALAAAAPRAKSNVGYQNEMIKLMREVNVDAQSVGWYTSTSMGNFVNLNFVENQAFLQKQADERTSVALVFDVSRSASGSLSLKAYRLSESFMTSYKEAKFSTESLQKSGLRYQDILIEIPIQIHNSHLLTSFLHSLPTPPPEKATLDFPSSLADLSHDPYTTSNPLAPNLDALDLSIDPFLEKTTDLLLDSIEAHQIEQNNAQYYQRSLAREQAKITAWQTKRKQENQLRQQQKQPLLDETEWTKLFKLPQEPSRLESLLVGRQVEQYSRQVDAFAATVSGKMFGVRGGLVPGGNAD